MFETLLFPIGVQLLLPVGLLLWIARRRHPSRLAWVMTVLLVAAVIVLLGVAGLWLLLPWYMPYLYGALLLPAAATSLARLRAMPAWPRGRRDWARLGLRSMLAVLAAGSAIYAVSGRIAPTDIVALTFPLRQGIYLVVNGGTRELLNAHLMTVSGERFRAYRGQSYGVDVVRIDRWGRRATGFQPREPSAYRIFGDSVFAPCAGRVVAVLDSLHDQSVPEVDRVHMAGNHVLLACGTVHVLLGHLQYGSVRVRVGSTVGIQTLLGQVGNTGNTGEPHLHIHAQRPGPASLPLSGDPLPIRLDTRFPARNLRLTWHP